MMRKDNVTGQSLLELLLLLSLLSTVLIALLPQVHEPMRERMQKQQASQLLLWRASFATDQQVLQASDDYALANASREVRSSLAMFMNFNLAADNLVWLPPSEDHVAVARLSDTWSARSDVELHSRPAQLTVAKQLENHGINKLLDIIGWLPTTEEFSSSSLKFGYVNDEATPIELGCNPKC